MADQPPCIMAAGEDGSSLLGLGYTSSNTTNDANNLDEMMKHYWQQCLEYHEQQESADQETSEAGVVFVASSSETERNPRGKGVENIMTSIDPPSRSQDDARLPDYASKTSDTQMQEKSEVEVRAAEAAMRAKEIIKGFQPVKIDPEANNSINDAASRAKAIIRKFQLPDIVQPEIQHSPNYYLAQRRQFYVKERQRLEKALLKNFSYVAQREEHRLEEKLAQIQESRELEKTLQQQQEARLRLKIQQQQKSQAGIGTKTRKKQQHMQNRQQNMRNAGPSASIYLSNLPCGENDLTAVIRGLFESYGTIRKIHLYRNKESGELKGDALVVYELNKSTVSGDDLVQSICQQLNGCQLPCGTILKAEPAVANRNNAAQEQGGSSMGNNISNNIPEMSKKADEEQTKAKELIAENSDFTSSKGGGKGEGEDLDDFFASLV